MVQGLESLSAEKQAVIVTLRDRYEASLRSLLERGVEARHFRPLDAALAGRGILGMLNRMIRWFQPGDPMRAEEVARFYFHFLLRGLRENES